MWTFDPGVEVDAAFVAARIVGSAARRAALLASGTDAARLVFSEADGVPGVVADRYGDTIVCQLTTAGADAWRDVIADALASLDGVATVFERSDADVRERERLEPRVGLARGRAAGGTTTIHERSWRFLVDIAGGHKTGFYLDQRENRETVGRLAPGREVLDAFCYTGAFTCWALVSGAARVLGIESSPDAAARARAHAAAHGGADRATVVEGNAFDVLRDLERDGARFDLVVLDPPPFTRRKTAVDAALRGYKEINLRALGCLRPGGLLATFSCSHHVGPALFEEVCRAAAGDARRPVRVRGPLGQAGDHPVLLAVPETRYLKGLLLEALE
jgi:23S rRNA (cytosine1962-C5)-methyltransferase